MTVKEIGSASETGLAFPSLALRCGYAIISRKAAEDSNMVSHAGAMTVKGIIGRCSKALLSIGLSVSDVLTTTFYTYPEHTPV